MEQLRCEPGAWTFWVSSPNKEQCNHCARILHHQLCIDDLVTYCKYSLFKEVFDFNFGCWKQDLNVMICTVTFFE